MNPEMRADPEGNGDLPRGFFEMGTFAMHTAPGCDDDEAWNARLRTIRDRATGHNGDIPRGFFEMGTFAMHRAPGFEDDEDAND